MHSCTAIRETYGKSQPNTIHYLVSSDFFLLELAGRHQASCSVAFASQPSLRRSSTGIPATSTTTCSRETPCEALLAVQWKRMENHSENHQKFRERKSFPAVSVWRVRREGYVESDWYGEHRRGQDEVVAETAHDEVQKYAEANAGHQMLPSAICAANTAPEVTHRRY